MAVLILAFLMVLGGGGAVAAALLSGGGARRVIARRVDLVAGPGEESAARAAARSMISAIGGPADRLHRLFALGMARQWGVKAGSLSLVLAALAGGGLAWAALALVFKAAAWILAPAVVIAVLAPPSLIIRIQQARAEASFTDRFPDAVDMVVRMIRAGLPVSQAIRTVGEEAAEPVKGVFAQVADQIEIGVPLADALSAAGDRVGLSDFRFFAVAVSLQHATGGNLASTLDILTEIIRKRRAMRLKAKAVTSEVRLSAYVLAAIPFVVVGGLLVIAPSYLTPLITDPRGNLIVAAAALALVAAFLVMNQMMRSATRL